MFLLNLFVCVCVCVCVCVASTWTCHCDEAAYEAEVGEVVRVDSRGRVDLQTVVALTGVLKQTVHGVQHFMGQQEEPLSEKKWCVIDGDKKAKMKESMTRMWIRTEINKEKKEGNMENETRDKVRGSTWSVTAYIFRKGVCNEFHI